MLKIGYYCNNMETEYPDAVYGEKEIYSNGMDINVEIDASSLLGTLVVLNDDSKTDFVIETKNPDYDFYFESISFTYNKDTNEIRALSSISGYLLERIK